MNDNGYLVKNGSIPLAGKGPKRIMAFGRNPVFSIGTYFVWDESGGINYNTGATYSDNYYSITGTGSSGSSKLIIKQAGTYSIIFKSTAGGTGAYINKIAISANQSYSATLDFNMNDGALIILWK